MFTKTIIKRTTETNSDVSNTPPTAKQGRVKLEVRHKPPN